MLARAKIKNVIEKNFKVWLGIRVEPSVVERVNTTCSSVG